MFRLSCCNLVLAIVNKSVNKLPFISIMVLFIEKLLVCIRIVVIIIIIVMLIS